MKYRALVSFAGKVTMYPGEIREIDKETAEGLLKAGYIEKIRETKKREAKK